MANAGRERFTCARGLQCMGTYGPFDKEVHGYLFERGLSESAWVPRATLASNALSVDLSGNTAMLDNKGLRYGTFPTVVNLPALREPDVVAED